MSGHLDIIKNVVRKWPNQEIYDHEFDHKPFQRLWGVLKKFKSEPDAVGILDVVVLVRHVLRCEEEKEDGDEEEEDEDEDEEEMH